MLRQRARQAGAAALLGKPVRAREIATAISRALRRIA
jgi:FixJ family two-component response regulator